VGLEYRIMGLTCGFAVFGRSCRELVLAGESVEDRSAAHLVIGEVDHWWGLGFGLSRSELPPCAVWPRGIDMVQVNREDPAQVAFVDDQLCRGARGVELAIMRS
jgi:hypothetical protein